MVFEANSRFQTSGKSHFPLVFFIKRKDETFECFKRFYKETVKLGKSVKLFRIDNGAESVNAPFKKFLGDEGIKLGKSAPRTAQLQNLQGQ